MPESWVSSAPLAADLPDVRTTPLRWKEGLFTRFRSYVRAWPLEAGWPRAVAIAVLGIGAVTPLLLAIRSFLGEGDTALLYMPVIVAIAAIGGLRASLIASFLGFFVAKYYFVPVYFSLQMEDPHDWVSLFVFVLIGLAMGVQTNRMQARRADLVDREHDSARLYQLSGEWVVESTVEGLCRRATHEVASLLLAPALKSAVYVFVREDDGALRLEARSEPGGDEALAQQVAQAAPDVFGRVEFASSGSEAWAVRLRSEEDEGALCVITRGGAQPLLDERKKRMLASIARLAATHLARLRLARLASQTEVLREADRLKSNVVSSVSHELKTPLAIVTAIVTNLLESDLEWNAQTTRAELKLATDALGRLDASIGDLLDLSRLESGSWIPQRDWCEVDEIFETVRRRVPLAQQDRLEIAPAAELPMLRVDYVQWTRMLGHIVENALTYSPADAPVWLWADVMDGELRTVIEDQGPGVERVERERVFDKFYRGSASTRVPAGTGLGLAISHEIVDYHGGRIYVEPRQPCGARFVVALPLEDVPTATALEVNPS